MNNSRFGTIGVELEFTEVPAYLVDSTHDASVESTISFKKSRGNINLGGEIVSPILYSYHDMYQWLKDKTQLLIKYGEPVYGSERSSIHFHIGYPAQNIEFLKKTFLWAIGIDYHLFRLGGFGKRPRGYINDFLYYRPLCSAPVVRTRYGYGRVFIPEDIMKIKTVKGFWTRYGDTLHINRRYVAQRYVGINFYSIYYRGTLEFRHFNQFLNYKVLSALGEFLSMAVVNVISSNVSEIERLDSFEDYLKFSKIEKEKIDLLLFYYNKTRWDRSEYDKLCEQNVMCHLEVKERLPEYYSDTKYCPYSIDYDDIKIPEITDSHSGRFDAEVNV